MPVTDALLLLGGSDSAASRALTIAPLVERAAGALAEFRADDAGQARCRVGARCRFPIGGAPAAVAGRDNAVLALADFFNARRMQQSGAAHETTPARPFDHLVERRRAAVHIGNPSVSSALAER